MPEVQQTLEEVMESLTGHDDNAVAQHFGLPPIDLGEKNSMMAMRAMVFVTKRRDGMSDDAARNFSMDLPLKAVLAYFLDPSEESEESGKDESASEQQPAPSPTSAS